MVMYVPVKFFSWRFFKSLTLVTDKCIERIELGSVNGKPSERLGRKTSGLNLLVG